MKETPETIKDSSFKQKDKMSSGTGAILMVMKQPHGIELQTQDRIISGQELEDNIDIQLQ